MCFVTDPQSGVIITEIVVTSSQIVHKFGRHRYLEICKLVILYLPRRSYMDNVRAIVILLDILSHLRTFRMLRARRSVNPVICIGCLGITVMRRRSSWMQSATSLAPLMVKWLYRCLTRTWTPKDCRVYVAAFREAPIVNFVWRSSLTNYKPTMRSRTFKNCTFYLYCLVLWFNLGFFYTFNKIVRINVIRWTFYGLMFGNESPCHTYMFMCMLSILNRYKS